MPTKQYAYQQHPVIWKVLLDSGSDMEDISHLVIDIQGLTESLDIVRPIEFTTSDVRITVSDANSDFSDNFTVGYKAPVTIKAGYLVSGAEQTEVLFSGEVISTVEDVKGRTFRMTVSDDSQKLREKEITDFGMEKHMSLLPGEENEHGSYPFPEAVAPVSAGSFTGPGLTKKDALRTEGDLDSDNVLFGENAIETEGGLRTENTVVTLKAPYRWKRIETLIDKILAKYNVTQNQVDVDTFEFENAYLSTQGRVGYDLDASDSSNIENFAWEGYVTDFTYQADKFYFLYSSPVSSSRAKLISYTPASDEYAVLAESTSYEQWWRLAVSGDANTFYILGTSGISHLHQPVLGVYDPSEPYPQTFIKRFEQGTPPTLSNYYSASNYYDEATHRINSGHYPPVLGMYYHFGFAPGSIRRQGILPDTRKGFHLREVSMRDEIYYLYANATKFGVAKISTAGGTPVVVLSAERDGNFNWLGCDFTMDGGVLYAGFTWQGATNSTIKLVKVTIS